MNEQTLGQVDVSSNLAAGAAQASRMADEIQRAVNGMISLSAQGITSLKESEIRLKYKGNPVATAGALAKEQFGDISGLDPILQTALKEQRDEFVANAEATEKNRQALVAWQQEQAKAARAAKGGGRKSAGDKTVAAQMREAQQWIERTRTDLEKYNDELAELAELNRLGYFKEAPEAYARAVAMVGEEFQKSNDHLQEMQAFTKDVFGDIISGLREGASAGDILAGVLDKVADKLADMAAQGFTDAFFGGSDTKSSGGGLFSAVGGFFKSMLSFDGGGYTGDGSRSGGLDGKGGFPAIVHPGETVIDHTKGKGQSAAALHVSVGVRNDGSLEAFVQDRAGRVVAQSQPGTIRKSVAAASEASRSTKSIMGVGR